MAVSLVSLSMCWCRDTRQRTLSLSSTKRDEKTNKQKKSPQATTENGIETGEKKYLKTTVVLFAHGPVSDNVFLSAIPVLEWEMKPHWVEKMNVLEGSFSVRQWCILFVSSLPEELCRPRNKQSFVNTDSLYLAARLKTFTPVLIANRMRKVCLQPTQGSFSRIYLCFHHSHSQVDWCCAPVTTKSQDFPLPAFWCQPSAQYLVKFYS